MSPSTDAQTIHGRYRCTCICIGSCPPLAEKRLQFEWLGYDLLLEPDAQPSGTKLLGNPNRLPCRSMRYLVFGPIHQKNIIQSLSGLQRNQVDPYMQWSEWKINDMDTTSKWAWLGAAQSSWSVSPCSKCLIQIATHIECSRLWTNMWWNPNF